MAVILVDDRRAGLQRLLHVEDGRQHLVVDLDLGGGLVRGALAVGEHRDHRLALPAHLVGGQHLLVLRPDLDQDQDRVDIVRHVLVREDARHARMLLGLRRVDRSGCGRDDAGCAPS